MRYIMTKVETLAKKIEAAVIEGYRNKVTKSGLVRRKRMFDKITIEGGYNGPLLITITHNGKDKEFEF